MSVSGETIDYGPCAFMDEFSHDRVYSSIDRNGRYAYSNQPSIGLWNLTRFAESVVPLLADETEQAVEIAKEILNNYISQYETNWLQGMQTKLGLTCLDTAEVSGDKKLIDALLNIMEESKADFTLTFYYLSKLDAVAGDEDAKLLVLFNHSDAMINWLVRWRERLSLEGVNDKQRQKNMLEVNPLYIPRNHQIEAAIRAAEDNNDFSVFHELHEVLKKPFVEQASKEKFTRPPKADEIVWKTFCGT